MDGDDVVVADGGGGLASRTKRCRAVPLAASCGASTLMATTRCSLSSKARSTMPHAAPADDLQHLVMAQPAQRAGAVGRRQEVGW